MNMQRISMILGAVVLAAMIGVPFSWAQTGTWVISPLPESVADSVFFDLRLATDHAGWLVGFETLPAEPVPFPDDYLFEEGEWEKGASKGEGSEDFFDTEPLETHGVVLRLLGGEWTTTATPEASALWSLYAADLAPDGAAWFSGKDYAMTVTLPQNEGGEGEGEPPSPTDWQIENVEWRVDYGDDWRRTGTVVKPGATWIRLHFSEIDVESCCDALWVDTGDMYAGTYSNQTTASRAGDNVTLTMQSDASVTGHFIITRVEWQGPAAESATQANWFEFDVEEPEPEYEVSGNTSLAMNSIDGAAPSFIPGPVFAPFLAVAAVSAEEAYFASAAEVFHYAAGIWETLAAPPLSLILDLAHPASGELLVAGATDSLGVIARGGGDGWMMETLPSVADTWRVHALATAPAGETWAVGYALNEDTLSYRGVALRHDGAEWAEETLPAVSDNWYLVDIAAPTAGLAWAIGKDLSAGCGIVLRRDSGGWHVENPPLPSPTCAFMTVAFPGPLNGMISGYDLEQERPFLLSYLGPRHAADQNGNLKVSLSELLRVIQFYNSDGLHCDPAGEDGFAAGPGGRLCAHHHSDYNPANWAITLTELLRLVQFYNSGGYYPCPDALPRSEDLFCVGSPG